MTFLNRLLKRVYQRVGFWGSAVILLPVTILLAPAFNELLSAGGYAMGYIVSGKVFADQFDIVHAGFTLDQPTIGKWLFWFSVMMFMLLPYMAAVRWVIDRRNRAAYLIYCIVTVIVCVSLLCVLLVPVSWLIQYVHTMGFTPKRMFGLMYGATGGILVIGFAYWAMRRPRKEEGAI